MSKILNIVLARIKSELFLYSFIFVSSLLLIMWSNILYAEILATPRKIVIGFFESLFTSFVLSFFTSFFKGRCRQIVRMVLMAIVALLLVFESFLLLHFNTLYSFDIASAVFHTNRNEALEMSGLFFSFPNLIFMLLIVAAVYGAACLLSKLFSSMLFYRWGIRAFLVALLPGIPCLALNLYTIFPRYYQSSIPVRFITSSEVAIRSSSYVSNLGKKLNEVRFKVVSSDTNLRNVVLIVGESLNRNFMHSYGFSVHNTPNMDSLVRAGKMYRFQDVTACASYTNLAVSRMLTMYTLESKGSWYDYPALPLILRRAGIRTYWLSAQEKMGENADEIASIVSQFDSAVYVGAQSSDIVDGFYDASVLPHLDSSMTVPLFEVVHLMGSHYNYSSRYPSSYSKFRASDMPSNYSAREQSILSRYVNSIYYNDYVVGRIIKFYEHSDAVVIYLPDHGESMFEISGKFGHGGGFHLPGTYSIPMFVWMSDRFKTTHPSKAAAIISSLNKTFTSDLVCSTLIDLLDIRICPGDPGSALFSPKYDEVRAKETKKLILTPEFDK